MNEEYSGNCKKLTLTDIMFMTSLLAMALSGNTF